LADREEWLDLTCGSPGVWVQDYKVFINDMSGKGPKSTTYKEHL
jgi:hypothetical protein